MGRPRSVETPEEAGPRQVGHCCACRLAANAAAKTTDIDNRCMISP